MIRLAAYTILRSGSATALCDVDRHADELGVDARDRGLLRRIIGTELRRRATLRSIVHAVAPALKNVELITHLHVALAQALFLDRIPPHEVLSECSEAVRTTLGPSKVRIAREFLKSIYERLENAQSLDPRRDLVGRNLSFREPVFRDPAQHPLLWAEEALSMPAPLLKRWTARHGEQRAHALARLALDEPPLSMCVVRGERAHVARELASLGVNAREGLHGRILLAPSTSVELVTSSAPFTEGRLMLQGESALRAAEALQARPGEELLHLCATATSARSPLAEGSEAQRAEFGEALGTRTFDGVLVDAPCSDTGVLAQRPEARWRFGPAFRAELAQVQTRWIERAAELVRPLGRMVWSTCALEPEENRRLIEAFLARHAHWSLAEERESQPDVELAQERGVGPVDGGYCARLVRR
ncbi:MAG: hypothetical protein FJ298_02485 [Planctomycetes bacterium]|nr:hypothetical protein [Planctomycetota bacterium]